MGENKEQTVDCDKKFTILIDMDDTIEMLVYAWVDAVNSRYGYSATVEDVTDWDVTKAFPGLTREQVYSVIAEQDFWKSVKPTPGAPEAVKRFIDAGHKVYIVTASGHDQVYSKMENVLFKYFPYLTFDDVIITTHKQLIKADILIDDGFHNLIGGDYHKILVDAPYNRAFNAEASGMVRVYNWNEIEEEVNRFIWKSDTMK